MSTLNTTDSTSTAVLGKRKAASKAREVIKAATRPDDDNDLYGVSDDERKKPARKRTKASSNNSNKLTTARVGTVKKGNDVLPVRAEQYANRCINYRVNRNDVSADVAERQATFLSTKRQVKLEDVTYDVNIFPSAAGVVDIQKLNAAGKKVRVSAYLTSIAGNPLAPIVQPAQAMESAGAIHQADNVHIPGVETASTNRPAAACEQLAPIVQPARAMESAGAIHQADDVQLPGVETASTSQPAAACEQRAPIVEAISAPTSGSRSETPAQVVETAPATRNLRQRKQPAKLVEKASASRSIAPHSVPAGPIVHPLSASLRPTTNVTLSSDIAIGTLKIQALVEVYAFLKPYGLPHTREENSRIAEQGELLTTACFRIHPREVDGEIQAGEGFPTESQTVFLSQVNVSDEFKKKDEAASREYIHSVLQSRYEARQQRRSAAKIQEHDDIAEARAHFKRPRKPCLSEAAIAAWEKADAHTARQSARIANEKAKKKAQDELCEVEEISDWDDDEVIPARVPVIGDSGGSGCITILKPNVQ